MVRQIGDSAQVRQSGNHARSISTG